MARSLPPPLPPETRTVGQLVADDHLLGAKLEAGIRIAAGLHLERDRRGPSEAVRQSLGDGFEQLRQLGDPRMGVVFSVSRTVDDVDRRLGLIGLAQFLPAIPLLAIAGYAADHFDRRKVVMLAGRRSPKRR
jgi:hypothetical protein